MALNTQQMTIEQFEAWVNLPENAEHDYEFIGGEIVHILAHPCSSVLAAKFAIKIGQFVDDNQLGHVTGADGGYQVGNERYMPDVGYISFAKQPVLQSEEGYIPDTPDLAVEVVSPNDSARQLTIKISNYLAAGTVVWVVYPDDEQMNVHAPGKPVHVFAKDDVLEGEAVLPDFKLKLSDIFK